MLHFTQDRAGGEVNDDVSEKGDDGMPVVRHEELANVEWSQLPNELTVDEVAGVLRMGLSWVYERIHDGRIPSFRRGRKYFVRKADLEVLRYSLGAEKVVRAEESDPRIGVAARTVRPPLRMAR